MQFPKATHKVLACLGLELVVQGVVFYGALLNGILEGVEVLVRLDLERDSENCRGQLQGVEAEPFGSVFDQSLPCFRLPQPADRHDIPSRDLVDRDVLVSPHPVNMTYLLGVVGGGVDETAGLLHLPRVDSRVGQGTHLQVVKDLEHIPSQRLCSCGFTALLGVLGVVDWVSLARRGQQVYNRVQKGLDPFVPEGGAQEDGAEVVLVLPPQQTSQSPLQSGATHLLVIQIQLPHSIVVVPNLLHYPLPLPQRLLVPAVPLVHLTHLHTLPVLTAETHLLHSHQVNHSFE